MKKRSWWVCGFVVMASWILAGCQPGGGRDVQVHLAPPPAYVPAVSPLVSGAGAAGDGAVGLSWMVSDLSPVQLLVSQGTELTLFGGESQGAGSRAPRYLALKHADTQHVFTNAATAVITNLNEGWLMAWGFQLAQGEADVPWAVYLQHAPREVRLDGGGLRLQFHGPMGWVGLVPLYGREFLAATPGAFAARKLDPKVHPKIWEWAKVVPREPLSRARLWASSLSSWPVAAWMSVEEGAVHARFEGVALPQEWHPAALKLAPLDGVLAGVMQVQPQGLKFSSEAFDLQMGTNGMTWWGVMQTDRYTVWPGKEAPQVWQGVLEQWKKVQAAGVVHERWVSWSFELPPGSGSRSMSRLSWSDGGGGGAWPGLQVWAPSMEAGRVGVGMLSLGEVRVGGRGPFQKSVVRMLTPNVAVTDYR